MQPEDTTIGIIVPKIIAVYIYAIQKHSQEKYH